MIKLMKGEIMDCDWCQKKADIESKLEENFQLHCVWTSVRGDFSFFKSCK